MPLESIYHLGKAPILGTSSNRQRKKERKKETNDHYMYTNILINFTVNICVPMCVWGGSNVWVGFHCICACVANWAGILWTNQIEPLYSVSALLSIATTENNLSSFSVDLSITSHSDYIYIYIYIYIYWGKWVCIHA